MNTKARSRGYSSVFIAITLAIALALLIAFIAISMPLAKSYVDKTHWAGEMSIYKPPNPINTTNGQPQFNGYCLVNTIGNVTYTTCPSTVGNTTIINGIAGMGTDTGTQSSQPPTNNQSTPQPTSSSIVVTVYDPTGAGWVVNWGGSATGSQGGVSTYSWSISASGPLNLGIQLTITPQGYVCSVTPQGTTANPGQSVLFNVTCIPQWGPITLSVTNDTLGATWQVSWGSSSLSESTNWTWTVYTWYSSPVIFNAQITNNPQGYTCSISPSTATAWELQTVTFTINCQLLTSPVKITVEDSYGALWLVTWSDTKGLVSGNMTGNTTETWTTAAIPYGDTLTINATILMYPLNYTSCVIHPQSTTATLGQSIYFYVFCQSSPRLPRLPHPPWPIP